MRLEFSARVRLIASLFVLLSLALGLGGFCYHRLSELRITTVELVDNALPSSRIIGQLAVDLETLRSQQLDYLLSNPQHRLTSLGRLRETMVRIETDLQEYAPLVKPGQESLWDLIQKTVPAYLTMSGKFQTRLSAGDEKGGADYLLNGMVPAFDAAREALKANIRFDHTLSHEAAEVATPPGDTFILAIAIVVAVVGAVTLAISYTASEPLFGPVRRVTGVMPKIADGELVGPLPNSGGHSEVGTLGPLQVFKDNLALTRQLEEASALVRALSEEQRRRDMCEMAGGFEGDSQGRARHCGRLQDRITADGKIQQQPRDRD